MPKEFKHDTSETLPLNDLTFTCNSFVTDKNIYATLFLLFNSFWDFFVNSIIIFSELKL